MREVRPGQGQSEGATGQQSPVIAGPVNYDSMRGIGGLTQMHITANRHLNQPTKGGSTSLKSLLLFRSII